MGVVEAVRAAEKVHEAAARPVIGAQRAAGGCHRFGAVLFLDMGQPGSISSSAWSQETRSHLPDPRAPTLFRGS